MSDDTLDDVRTWFGGQGDGWDLTFERDGEICWAHLTRRLDRVVTAPRYGSGRDEAEAARSAQRRWQVEQIGSLDEGRPRDLP